MEHEERSVCSDCGRPGVAVALGWRNTWAACHDCRVSWPLGAVATPGTEAEWADNRARLRGYRVVHRLRAGGDGVADVPA